MTTAQDHKQREKQAWASVADGWRRRDALLKKGATPVTERMLALAGISEGQRVLDIASGVGEPAMAAAERVGSSGRVVGTDLVDEMLAYAREKARDAGADNIEFRCIDGETLCFDPDTFDAVTCRWGLMFMPEPEKCLSLARQVMKQDARLAVACWSAMEKNPFVGVLMQVLARHMELPKPPPGTPGIFALADPDRLRGVISQAGFNDIELEELEIDVVEVEDGQAYWNAMSDLAAPVMTLVSQLDEEARARYIDDVIATADAMKQGVTLRMRGTTWIASASC